MPTHTEVLTDPNLAYLDAEMRLLALELEGTETPENVRNTEAFLSTLRTEAAAHGWVLMAPRIATAFQLDEFERRVLLLAAAPEIDPAFGERIARAQGGVSTWPTVALAWRLLARENARWLDARDSFRDDAPPFRFELLRMLSDAPLPERILRADRRVVDALLGRNMPDARLTPYVHSCTATRDERDSAAEQVGRCIAEHLLERRAAPLIVHLYGSPVADLEAFAARAVYGLNRPLLAASGVPLSLAVPLVREPLLLGCALFLSGVDLSEWARTLASGSPMVFFASEQQQLRAPAIEAAGWVPVEVARPDTAARAKLWSGTLTQLGITAEPSPMLAENFGMSRVEIRHAAELAAIRAWLRGETPSMEDVFEACRADSQHRMTELAQKLTSSYEWADLLVPPEAAEKLHELCGQVRAQRRVLDEYGFGATLSRGRGVTALFSGPSGTGKTMAAEVIARQLQRDLYRVDLARVVSKYIGETEKNLRQIFIEAERARCVVLFDEADALFGRRTEIRDSHDRYANIEVSYLLQLLEESAQAVVLLATNRREAIDEAFVRRFRFIVDFPLPDTGLRRELWQRSFPRQVPMAEISFDALAERLPLSGANIRNIALAASFLAANDGGVVHAGLIAQAARREMEKLGRPATFSDVEFALSKGAK